MNSSQRHIHGAAGALRTKTLSLKVAVIAANIQPALTSLAPTSHRLCVDRT
jgi:hypothetical protein